MRNVAFVFVMDGIGWHKWEKHCKFMVFEVEPPDNEQPQREKSGTY